MRYIMLCSTLGLVLGSARAQTPVGTAFTYQGRLKLDQVLANEGCDFRFGLWDAETGGFLVGGPLVFDEAGGPPDAVSVEKGLFSVELDFGDNVIGEDALWLEIEVACPSGSEYVAVAPRQLITPTPFATSGGGWTRSGLSNNSYKLEGNVGIGMIDPAEPLSIHPDENDDAVGFYGNNAHIEFFDSLGLPTWHINGSQTAFRLSRYSSGGQILDEAIRVLWDNNEIRLGSENTRVGLAKSGAGGAPPEATLHVKETGSEARVIFHNDGPGAFSPDTVMPGLELRSSLTSVGMYGYGISFTGESGLYAGIWPVSTEVHGPSNGGTRLVFGTKANNVGSGGVPTQRMVIDQDGTVGINVTNPTVTLDVGGTMQATACICPSDRRLKKDIEDISDALATTLALRGVTYHWRTDALPHRGFPSDRQVGMIAQDVREVLPEVVTESRDGLLAVDYAKVVPTLVEAIRELHELAEMQEAQLEIQQQRIEQLAERVEAIEAGP